MMDKKPYICPKCGNHHYVSDQFQATGGNFAKIFDVQNKKFITVSCTNCGYTELYYQKQNKESRTQSSSDIKDVK